MREEISLQSLSLSAMEGGKMNNINNIVQQFLKLNPTNFGFDLQGRLLIKIKDDYSCENIGISEYEEVKVNAKHKVFKGFIHPEDRISRQPILSWLNELAEQADYVLHHSEIAANSGELAKLFNMSALVYCLMGDIDKATQLCNKQIDYFVTKSKENINLLKFCMQPWINLGRIDRVVGEFPLALAKFSILRLQDDAGKYLDLGRHQLERETLFEAIQNDNEVSGAVRACAFIEPIKTYLANGAFAKISSLSKIELSNQSRSLHGIAYESLILANVQMGRLSNAYYIVKTAIKTVPPHLIHVFQLREGELLAVNGDHRAKSLFQKILDLIKYDELHSPNIQAAVFSVRAASQFLKFGYKELAYEAASIAYKMTEEINDEFLKIECLEILFKSSHEVFYQNVLQEIVRRTGYPVILDRYRDKYIKVDKTIRLSINSKSLLLFDRLMAVS